MRPTTSRRIALLTGASVAALGMSALTASPALAAPPHTAFGTGTAAGTDTTSSSVVICDLATNADCFFGVVDSGAAAATANVNAPANGQIYQHLGGPTVTLTMTNAAGDSAEVGAIALGTTAANATMDQGIRQTATGGDLTLNLDNNGALLVDALAVATNAATPAAIAAANATQVQAVFQSALGSTV